VRDAALVQRLARDNLPVEVCPSSNVSLEIFESLDAHRSFPELWRVGLNVTVNSDDPPFFSTTLAQELGHTARLELKRDDVLELQRRAARAAFATPDERSRLEDLVQHSS